jgi:hypothetical protein
LMSSTAGLAARTDYRPGSASARFETWAATISTAVASSAIRTSATTSTVAASAAIASTALRALKARTGIGANARGIAPNKFFAGCIGITRCARLAGQQDRIFLGNRCGFAGLACICEPFGGGLTGNDGFLMTFAFGGFPRFVLFFFGAKCNGILVLHVAAVFRFLPGFRAIRFGVFCLMLRMLGLFVFVRFAFVMLFGGEFGFFFLFFLFFRLFHFGSGRKFFLRNSSLGFFVLRFNKLSRECPKLFIAQRGRGVLHRLRYGFFDVGNAVGGAGVFFGFSNRLLSGR